MEKIIELKTSDKLFYYHYLQVLNGVSGLSSKETTLLAELLRISEFDDNVLEHIELSHQTKILIKKLKDKKILINTGEYFTIHPTLLINKENTDVTFRLRLV